MSLYKRLKSSSSVIIVCLIIVGYHLFFSRENKVGLHWHKIFSDSSNGFVKKPVNNSNNSTLPAVGCRVPNLDPFHPSIKHLVSVAFEPINCHLNSNYPLFFNSSVEPYPHLFPAKPLNGTFLINCSYQNIERPNEWDFYKDASFNRQPQSFPVSLDGETKIPRGHDFIVISCEMETLVQPVTLSGNAYILTEERDLDMHAFVHPKHAGKQRRKARKGSLNVIILGLDSMSRMSFHRDMPNTYKYLMDEMGAAEMTAYHKIGDNTFPNILPMLTNRPTINESSLECEFDGTFDECPFIWKRFADSGYKTLFAEDEYKLAMFNLDKEGFIDPPTDYYFRTFLNAAEDLIGHMKGYVTYSCYGPRLAFQVMLDYMQKMSYVMTHNRKRKRSYFQFAWSSSTTHDNLNGGRPLDQHLQRGLQWWMEGGYLNDTILVLMSDHGVRWGDMHNYYQGQLEDRLPFMYIVVPPWFGSMYPKAFKNLMDNRNRLVTAVDLHLTLIDILALFNSSSLSRNKTSDGLTTGISLFQPIPQNRTCKMAGVEEAYCTCNHHITALSVHSDLVQIAANFAVYSINSGISSHGKCAYLSLAKVFQAVQVTFADGDFQRQKERAWAGYQLSFQTTPGNATFEAFIFWDKVGRWNVSGQIGRTNLYGNQSHCVKDKRAKLYCYCLEFLNLNSESAIDSDSTDLHTLSYMI